MDRTYSDWVRDFLDESGPRILDELTGEFGEIPSRASHEINAYSLTYHLYKRLIGWSFPSGTGPTFLHRLRFISIQFHFRRSELISEAESFVWTKVAALKRIAQERTR